MTQAVTRDLERELHEDCASYYADPLGFVLGMYPWPVKGQSGPDQWQADALTWIGQQVRARGFHGLAVEPIRFGTSTGHGVGKTAFFAWITIWLMSTRRDAVGTITANTSDQLQTKTWAAVREWTARCATAHWFEINSAIMYRRGKPENRATWMCHPLTCDEHNAEAFQGQHSLDSTSFYIFDEASGIPAGIWTAAEGGLSTGEPMIFVGGNATRNSGEFHRVCFGSGVERWTPRIIDARTCRLPSKPLIAQWLQDYGGEDSDFFRVRVRGLPPRASELQYIDQDRLWAAQQRATPVVLGDEPLIAGVDVSGGGSAWNVVRFRRGFDARSIPPIRIPGEATRKTRDTFVAVLAGLLADQTPRGKVAMMFVDSAYGAPYVERLHTMGYRNVEEVNAGATSPDDHQLNMRAHMWYLGKEWLRNGAILASDVILAQDLAAPGQHLNAKNQLVIESKESIRDHGGPGLHDADAHMLTFAAPVRAGAGISDEDLRPSPRSSWQA